MSIPFHQQQLEFMIHLAQNRIDCLNPLFRFLNYFDSVYFFFTLVPIVWIGFSYRWGLRIFYWFTLNSLVNSFVKMQIGWSRPSMDAPEIGMFHPTSYGFPSNGAQGCMFLGSLLIYYGKTKAAWIVGITYIALVSFSRLYLGVHYPIDILGGWVLAWLFLGLFILFQQPLEKWLYKKGLPFSLLLSLAIPLAVGVLFPQKSVIYIMGSLMGVGLGTYFSLKYHLFLPPPKSLREGVARSLVGLLLIFVIFSLYPGDKSPLKSFTISLFMSLAASPLCHRLTRI